eukprot:5386286-Lingulodinium_polyedra.AAC.1
MKIIGDGGDPCQGDYFMDIGASPTRQHVGREQCVCLTKGRCQRQTVFATRTGKVLTTKQMMLLQGFPAGSMERPEDVPERVFRGCIGNAMSPPVLGSWMRLLLITLGYIAKESVNPWS